MCTSVMVGKLATDNGTILLARNEDYAKNNWNKYLKFRPIPEYHDPENNPVVKDGIWTLGNGMKVPVPDNTFSYSAIPDYNAPKEASNNILNRYFFEERGINEMNVAVSATNSMPNINEKVLNIDPFIKPGIEEPVIPTLILPQATSARHAVELLGSYVENFGASEGNGILFGDPNESWYMEIGSGKHWIAVRIPDDKYLMVANGLRIHNVDLASDTVMYSTGLFEFVKTNNLLKDPDENNFNFAMAFGTLGVLYNTCRIWLGQKLLSPSKVQSSLEKQYPLFLKPDNNIAVKDVMKVLRATYQGTPLEGIAKRPIGVARTAESHIIVLDDKMPFELQGTIWQCISTPLGAPYMPLYTTLRDIPNSYDKGSNIYNKDSSYWSFRGLYALVSNLSNEKSLVDVDWNVIEEQFLDEHDKLNELLKNIYKEDKEKAISYAANRSTDILYKTVEKANDFFIALMTAISNKSQDSAA